MNFEIVNTDASSMLSVTLQNGEELFTESGAMVTRSSAIQAKASTRGGFFKGLKRMLGGESFFVQKLIAEGNGEVLLAPSVPGGIHLVELNGNELMLQKGAFLAAESTVDVDTKFQKLSKGFLSGTGLLVLGAQGTGNLAMTAFGGLREIEIAAGEELIVDTGHIVAWEKGMNYEVETDGGFFNSIGTGEVLVCRFTGPGKLWIQSRNPDAFGAWMQQYMPSSSSGSSFSNDD